MTHERQPVDRVHVIFVACTDDENAVAYLNQWDRNVRNVDVIDDYWSERREILRVQVGGTMSLGVIWFSHVGLLRPVWRIIGFCTGHLL